MALGVAVAFAGVWGLAKYRITDRLVAYSKQAKQSCAGRGADTLSADDVGARVRAAADQAGVELLALRVTVEPLTRANAARAGAVVQAAVEQAQALAKAPHFSGMPGGGPNVQSFGQLAIMNATVRAEQWLWSEERDVESTCVRH